MAHDAVLQVRMDSQLKHDVEALYRQMGTTFSEAVRIFAQQSLLQERLPIQIAVADTSVPPRRTLQAGRFERASGERPASAFGMFAKCSNEQKRLQEKDAWLHAASRKHGGND